MNIFKNYIRLWMLLIASIMSCAAIAQDDNYGIGDGFDPANPANPGSNGWNAATGEVIIDDFTTGNLNNTITNKIGNSGSDAVTQIVVAGVINNTDFRVGNNYAKCTLVDFSRTAGISAVPSSAYRGDTILCNIMLPTSITEIGSDAFSGCSSLSVMTCYTITPPKVGSNAFYRVNSGMIVYVPSGAVGNYQEADVWKDFTILPIQETVHSLTVKLPTDIDLGTFKNMTLELVNAKSGQSYRYIITDKNAYVFNNLIENTVYKAYVKNSQNNIFGETNEVSINDKDAEVTFSSLSIPQTVNLSILAGGNDITSEATITWTDPLGNYISQGASLTGYEIGKNLNYSIALPQNIVMEYALPNTTQYVVADGGNNIVCTLTPLQKVVITGKVLDLTTKSAISGAVVSASQTFGGKYSKTTNAKTDAKGQYSIEIFRVPTSLAIAASDHISQTMECDVMNVEEENFSVADVSLKSISGDVISLGFTYTKTPDNEGEDGSVESYYSDYNNVDYTIFNKTQNRNIGQFNVQYPQIVLLEEVNENDVLELTASSRTSAFVPVKATATIDAEQRASATFNIVELGKLRSTFAVNGNASVVGSLYDAKGKLIKTYDYSGSSLTISDLADGNYTLVTMGSSRLFNTIYDLSQLPQTGLTRDVDYVQSSVKVESGKLSVISIAEVSTLDESKLYYTGDNTSFTVNKASIVAGNYLTLTGHLDFKSAYSTKVSNVNLIVDLPESCSFVENSVMVGNSTSSYTLEGNRVIIPMARYTDRVRFCIIPTLGGDYAPSALVQFDIDGETITQPIGSAHYMAEDLSIKVPSTVATTTIPVSGTAIGASDIEIYDNDVMVGQTRSLANGLWSTTVELNNPYNLSVHKIYAKVRTKSELELLSKNMECTYDMNAIQISKVTMYHWNPEMRVTYESVFDFQNPSTKPNQWTVYYPKKIFTYTVDFTVNDPERISNVVLYVHAANGQIVPLTPEFNKEKGLWIANLDMGNRNDGYYPVNVSVDFDAVTSIIGDRSEISEKQEFLSEIINEAKTERDNLISEYNGIEEEDDNSKTLQSLLGIWNADEDEINRLFDIILGESSSAPTIILTDEEIESLEIEADKKISEWDNVHDSALLNRLLEDCFDDPSFDYGDEMSFSIPTDEGIKTCKREIMKDVDEERMTSEGYTKVELTDGSSLYYLYSDNSVIIVDVLKKEKYSIDITETANSSSRHESRRVNIVGYLTCGKNAINTIKDVCGKVQSSSDNRRRMAEIAAGLLAVKNDLACYYDGLYTDLIGNIKKAYDNANDIINADKKVYSDLKGICEFKLKEIRKNIADLEEINNSYKHDLYILNGKESLTDAEKAMKANLESMLKEQEKTLREFKQDRQKWYNKTKKYEKQLEKLTKKGNIITKHYIKIKNSIVGKLPAKLTKFTKLPTTVKVCGKIAGTCGIAIQIIGLYTSVTDIGEDAKEWLKVMDMIDAKLPCDPDGDPLKEAIYNNAAWHIGQNFASLASDAAGVVISAAGGVPGSPTWWIDMAVNVLLTPSRIFNGHASERDRNNYIGEIYSLKCEKDCGQPGMPPCPDPDPNPGGGGPGGGGSGGSNGNGGGSNGSGSPNDNVRIDPSGYVYEGVFSNRLEGVTATCYYKETIEDMYGDKHENIVKWDAAEYAQENPLFTDENGYYRWDVPQGLWQVKFEKEGYETTYSEWLPVPPPQLDINIAMKQNVQPTVKSARAFEDAVEMEFDKYMMPEMLNTENIRVMTGETAVEGTVELLNEEVSYEGNEEKFASKVRFNAAAPFDATEVTLMVSNRVKSYAGIRMQDDFSQTFTIEPEVQKIVCDAEASIEYGGQGELTVQVLPAVASAGKTLKVKSSSAMILSTDVEELTLDNEGKASLKVGGELPGAAAITYSVDGYDLSATTMVNVEQVQLVPDKPLASIASGSALLKGTQITLSCPTSSAEIYYTTDGSCPCEAGAKKYDGTPITISEGTTLKIMAKGKKGDESEIVTYTYTLRQTNLNVPLVKGWNWVSHNQDVALTSDKLEMDNVDRVLTQIGELYRDPKIGFTGHIDDVNATDAFKVHTTDAGNLQLGGVMYNPYFSPVELKRGWNWLGYPLEKPMTVDDAFSLMESEVNDYIVNLEGGFAQFNGDNWIGTLETLSPGKGYLFKSASDKELAYNIFAAAAPSANAASVIPSDDMPWQYDSHAYPNVMCVTADLYIKDVKAVAGEYLVGAFIDGECRGVGRYVDNTLFLSVHGDKNVEMTLLAMDNESGVVYDITEKLMFTPDVVGSVSMPYPLHVGSPTGISHITMGISGFKSIHNVLGQKVKSIDRGGVFIIDGRKRVVTKRNEQEYLK